MRQEKTGIDGLTIVRKSRRWIEEKKGEDVVVLDVRQLSTVTDYFLICTATSQRHIKALVEALKEALDQEGMTPAHVDGFPDSPWVVLDYIDAIVHIFDPETRACYRLEQLWGDALRVL